MKRITLKLSQEDHKRLKLLSLELDLSIKEILTRSVIKFIKQYMKELKENNHGLLDEFLKSKKDTYEDYEELITVSIEIEDALHSILKYCCELENSKLKHVMRGVILDALRGEYL